MFFIFDVVSNHSRHDTWHKFKSFLSQSPYKEEYSGTISPVFWSIMAYVMFIKQSIAL